MGVTEKASQDWLQRTELLDSVLLSYQTDSVGCFTYASPALRNLLGIDSAEIIGQSYYSLFNFQHALATFPVVCDSGTAPCAFNGSRRAVVRRKGGELAVLELHEQKTGANKHASQGVAGIAHDVTCYVSAMTKLTHSEQQYRRLIEGLGGEYVIYTHYPDGELTYVSPSVQEVLGFEPRELLGQNWWNLLGEKSAGKKSTTQVLQDFQAGILFYKFSVEISDSSGEKRLLEIQQHPVFSPEGAYVLMEGIAKDITAASRNAEELRRLKDELEERVSQRTFELSQINARLAESEFRYRSVVEDQTEFVCRWNEGGVYTFVNEAYCRYMQKSRTELLGTSFLPHVVDEDRTRVLAEIGGLTPQFPTVSSEHRVVALDGMVRWHHWTNRALFDSQGNLKGYQSVGRDITDLKLAEDLVQEREDHLKRVSRLATMGELISGIAHEIHQPLHAAQLFAEAARRNLEMEGTANIQTAIECTREISNSISRTATIIRQLRAFTTSKPSEFELLDMNEIIHEVAAILSYETRKAGVKLHWSLQKRALLVSADRAQMQQVLVDWFRNAFEAMSTNEPGNRHLVVSTRRDHKQLIVEVCDNGAGTEIKNTERLFDAFYSTKPARLGMGLSICKTIAESHRATVSATNNSDHGMTFALHLPIAKRTKS